MTKTHPLLKKIYNIPTQAFNDKHPLIKREHVIKIIKKYQKNIVWIGRE